MNPSEYQTIFQVEERHWWYVGMKAITVALLHQLYPQSAPRLILDAGCGTGGSIRYLAQFGSVTGVDFSPHALHFCRQRQLERLNQASVMALPFANGRFDLVTSFDVIYHQAVSDDHQAIREFHRVLKPGGHLLLRLPAYDWLRGHHDTIIHTARRYTTQTIADALQSSQFEVVKLSYANTLLFPLALGKRVAERFFPPQTAVSDIKPNPDWQDKLLTAVLRTEANWLGRGGRLPFGLTVIAIGRKS